MRGQGVLWIRQKILASSRPSSDGGPSASSRASQIERSCCDCCHLESADSGTRIGAYLATRVIFVEVCCVSQSVQREVITPLLMAGTPSVEHSSELQLSSCLVEWRMCVCYKMLKFEKFMPSHRQAQILQKYCWATLLQASPERRRRSIAMVTDGTMVFLPRPTLH